MYLPTISAEEILEKPLATFIGEILVIDSLPQVKEAINFLSRQPVVGFDTEKKPTFSKGQYHPTALVQLACESHAFLFRLNKVGFPKELIRFFESKSTQKIGISIKDDIIDLKKINSFLEHGFVELCHITTEIGISDKGLRNLAAIFLDLRISKAQQTSNWEINELSENQKEYAALDAWVPFAIYTQLSKQGFI